MLHFYQIAGQQGQINSLLSSIVQKEQSNYLFIDVFIHLSIYDK